MALGDKYHAADTDFTPAPDEHTEPEATYDAGAYNYQIVNHSDDIIALFEKKEHRDHMLALLNANPFPE